MKIIFEMSAPMKALLIVLMMVLSLMLYGCGERDAEVKTQTAGSVKELTLEEKFAQTKMDADAGNAQAQFNLGVMYVQGEGVPKDDAKAVKWYQKAAAQGHADAQFNLAAMSFIR